MKAIFAMSCQILVQSGQNPAACAHSACAPPPVFSFVNTNIKQPNRRGFPLCVDSAANAPVPQVASELLKAPKNASQARERE
jgi:hypothetical protein